MKYEEMLEKGLKQLPEEVIITSKRYEVPKAKGHIEGNKTIITNFVQIASALGRDIQHFLKYILKELASPGRLEGGRLILGRKITPTLINAKIKRYADTYVLCYECKRPDTKLIGEGGILFMRCTACGAKHAIKE